MALVDCAECGKPVSTKATACPHCGAPSTPTPSPGTVAPSSTSAPKRRGGCLSVVSKVLMLGLLIIVGGGVLVTLLTRTPSRTTSNAPVGDDAAYFIWKYGPPDRDESTEHEIPRPPMVTRWLTYRNERVRLIYYPDTKPGAPPPYRGWKLMGTLDTERDQNLSPDEVARRMAPRKRHE